MNEATEVKKSATAIILKKYEEVSITKILGYGSLFFLLAGLFVHGYQEDAFSMMYINAGMTPCSQILQNNEEDFMASMGVIFSIIDWVKLAQFCNFCKVFCISCNSIKIAFRIF